MTGEHPGEHPTGAAGPVASSALLSGSSDTELTPALRLQILTTEHWSLLSSRSMSWNEAFSRATMFLSALSGAVVALALVAQATSFGEGFSTFAILVLPVVLFVGVTTFVRLVEINHEDFNWVAGMNMLRHAYLEAAPELRPYFISGWHDDEAGIMTTFGARVGPGTFAHQFVTTPGVVAIIDGVLAGVLAGIVVPRMAVPTTLGLAIAVAVSLVTVGLLAAYQYRGSLRAREPREIRFPSNGERRRD